MPIPSSAAPSGSSTATARLSDAPVSWSWLYGLWQSGRLTRLALADVADSAQVHRYFFIAPSASPVSPRSRLAEFLSVVSVGLAPRVPASGPLACVSPASLPVPGLLSVPTGGHFLKSEAPRQERFDERSARIGTDGHFLKSETPRQERFDERSARIDTDAHSLNSVLPASTRFQRSRRSSAEGAEDWARRIRQLAPASSPRMVSSILVLLLRLPLGFWLLVLLYSALVRVLRVLGLSLPKVRNRPWVLRTRGDMMAMASPPCLLLQTAAVSQGLRFKCFVLKVQCVFEVWTKVQTGSERILARSPGQYWARLTTLRRWWYLRLVGRSTEVHAWRLLHWPGFNPERSDTELILQRL